MALRWCVLALTLILQCYYVNSTVINDIDQYYSYLANDHSPDRNDIQYALRLKRDAPEAEKDKSEITKKIKKTYDRNDSKEYSVLWKKKAKAHFFSSESPPPPTESEAEIRASISAFFSTTTSTPTSSTTVKSDNNVVDPISKNVSETVSDDVSSTNSPSNSTTSNNGTGTGSDSNIFSSAKNGTETVSDNVSSSTSPIIENTAKNVIETTTPTKIETTTATPFEKKKIGGLKESNKGTVIFTSEDDDSKDSTLKRVVEGYDTTNTTVDHHRYYKSIRYSGHDYLNQYWVDMVHPKKQIVHNDLLSNSHRRAVTVPLTFDFPFYGHIIRNITIATGGFLYTGNVIHTWLAATQYIAPLMANFDTTFSPDATVKHKDNGTSLTVQWENVSLRDDTDGRKFTFQTTLHNTGDIVFAYKDIPYIVTKIENDEHPVKVGLSDAYIVEKHILYVRRKTIYEYHKIDMANDSLIANWTAIVFKALPTCVSMNTCDACLNKILDFQCQWCQHSGRCSDGLDRHRQDWLLKGCDRHNIIQAEKCKGLPPPPTPSTLARSAAASPLSSKSKSTDNGYSNTSPSPISIPTSERILEENSGNLLHMVSDGSMGRVGHLSDRGAEQSQTQVGAVIGVVFLVTLILSLAGWVTYAYFFPHSASGQFLIKYRPSTWSWRHGEVKYTAAAMHSIHM